ncbi:hypothetical protein D3C86_1609020 [compost metagenome]
MSNLFQLAAIFHHGVKDARTVDMQRQIALPGERPRGFQVFARKDFTVMGIFQTEQFGPCEVNIVGFDFGRDFIQRQGAVRRGINRLRLNAAEHCRTTGFVQIVMRALAHNILFAALAMAEQCDQIGLCAGGQEQRRLFPA